MSSGRHLLGSLFFLGFMGRIPPGPSDRLIVLAISRFLCYPDTSLGEPNRTH